MELRAEEPRRAVVAAEMNHTGNYVQPTIHQEPYYNKPPVYNWLIAASFTLFGLNDWAARLPGTLFFILTAALLFVLLKRFLDLKHAIIGALSYLCVFDLLFYATVNAAEIDLFYSFVIFLQLSLIYLFGEQKQWLNLFIWSYALTAIGFLTKGPPSILFQGITLLVYFIAFKHWKKLFSLQHLLGLLCFLFLVGTYLYAYSFYGNPLEMLVRQLKESSQRTAAESRGLGQIALALINFPVNFIIKLLPASLLLIPLIKRDIRKAIWKNSFTRYLILFFLFNILIYWISPEVRIRYVYMFFPVTILIGTVALSHTRYLDQLNEKRNTILFWVLCILFSLATISAGVYFYKTGLWFWLNVALLLFLTGLLFLIKPELSKNYYLLISLGFLVFGARVVYNMNIARNMHALNPNTNYKNEVSEMIREAKGQKVYLYGIPMELESDVTIFGFSLVKGKQKIPTEIPYQIPYYYIQKTGEALKFRETIKSQHYYLLYEEQIPEGLNYTVFDTIYARNVNKNLLLIFSQ